MLKLFQQKLDCSLCCASVRPEAEDRRNCMLRTNDSSSLVFRKPDRFSSTIRACACAMQGQTQSQMDSPSTLAVAWPYVPVCRSGWGYFYRRSSPTACGSRTSRNHRDWWWYLLIKLKWILPILMHCYFWFVLVNVSVYVCVCVCGCQW